MYLYFFRRGSDIISRTSIPSVRNWRWHACLITKRNVAQCEINYLDSGIPWSVWPGHRSSHQTWWCSPPRAPAGHLAPLLHGWLPISHSGVKHTESIKSQTTRRGVTLLYGDSQTQLLRVEAASHQSLSLLLPTQPPGGTEKFKMWNGTKHDLQRSHKEYINKAHSY